MPEQSHAPQLMVGKHMRTPVAPSSQVQASDEGTLQGTGVESSPHPTRTTDASAVAPRKVKKRVIESSRRRRILRGPGELRKTRLSGEDAPDAGIQLREGLRGDHRRRVSWPRKRSHHRWLPPRHPPERRGSRRGSGAATARAVQDRESAQRARCARDLERRLRRAHHGHLHRDPRAQRRPALPRLLRHRRQVPPRARRPQLRRQVRLPRLPRGRARQRA